MMLGGTGRAVLIFLLVSSLLLSIFSLADVSTSVDLLLFPCLRYFARRFLNQT